MMIYVCIIKKDIKSKCHHSKRDVLWSEKRNSIVINITSLILNLNDMDKDIGQNKG